MPSRSDDPFGAALDAALTEVVAGVRALTAARPRVLIDGRSGSGKTTLAARLAAAWPHAAPVTVIAMDDFYPGWDGLAEASRMLAVDILAAHAAGRDGAYHRWDWERDRPLDPAASGRVAAEGALLVEGCGALTPETRGFADLAIWVDAPEESRKRRALERDGEGYAPHWRRWAAQERAHISRHRPAELADLVFALP